MSTTQESANERTEQEQTTEPTAPQQPDAPDSQQPSAEPSGTPPETPTPQTTQETATAPTSPPHNETSPEPKPDETPPAKLKAREQRVQSAQKQRKTGSATPSKPKEKAPQKTEAQRKKDERLAKLNDSSRGRGKKASEVAKAKAADKPKRADDPNLQLAHKATMLIPGGMVDGKAASGSIPGFGAVYNSTQMRELKEFTRNTHDIPKAMGTSLAVLERFAKGEVTRSDLPEKTREALNALNKKFDPKRKTWPRKVAGGLVVLHRERMANKRTRDTAAKKKEKEAATTA